MISFPFCKINLGLHIIDRRNDGFHNIETCLYPVHWNDVVEVIPSPNVAFTSTGLSIPGNEENNICLKAWKLLHHERSVPPAHIHLHKIVPIGAGLGGGSADGAFTLTALNQVFSIGLDAAQLQSFASKLGSDCAFFLRKTAALASGRGEELTSLTLTLKGKYIAITMPDVHVSTAGAYANVTPQLPAVSLLGIISGPIGRWRELLINDFERSVFKKYPVLAEIKGELYEMGAIYASMSGSGAAVFGIFENDQTSTMGKFHARGYVTFCARLE